LDLLQEAHEILIDSPLYVDDSTGLSSVELRSKARRMHKRYQVKAIFVDYLQLMRNRGRVENRQVEVSDFSRSIKSMAHSLMVPVIVLAQLNRNPEARTGNKPMLSDLRESGAIEQDADVVMLIHREEYYRRIKGEVPPDDIIGKAEIIVAKQRNGPTGTITVQFNSDCAKFRPLAREYYEV
jgi:replicative DNA helicase